MPFIVGNYMAKSLQDAQLRDAIRLDPAGTDIGQPVVLSILRPCHGKNFYGPKLGVDLRGGTILVYEIDPGQS